MDVTRARDGRIRICRHMRHYMPGSSMNAISQDSIFSAADRTRGGRFERRAYRYRQEERPLTTEVCHQVRAVAICKTEQRFAYIENKSADWRAP